MLGLDEYRLNTEAMVIIVLDAWLQYPCLKLRNDHVAQRALQMILKHIPFVCTRDRTRSVMVQELLAAAGGASRKLLLDAFRGHIHVLVWDRHGSYVVQKIIEVMPPTLAKFVLEEIAAMKVEWYVLVEHPYTSRVLQRILEHFPHHWVRDFVSSIANCIERLAKHPRANYVLQTILEHGSEGHRRMINQIILSKVTDLSLHFHGKHVVVKAMHVNNLFYRKLLVRAAVRNLALLTAHGLGIFVIREMSAYADAADQKLLKRCLAKMTWGAVTPRCIIRRSRQVASEQVTGYMPGVRVALNLHKCM